MTLDLPDLGKPGWAPKINTALIDLDTRTEALEAERIQDTGWRALELSLQVRRIGKEVFVRGGVSSGDPGLAPPPAGFTCSATGYGWPNVFMATNSDRDGLFYVWSAPGGGGEVVAVDAMGATIDVGSTLTFIETSYPTDDPWPEVLPGNPAA